MTTQTQIVNDTLASDRASRPQSEARQLLERAQNGDTAAFKEWLDEAGDLLRKRFLSWQCADHETDDLAQETALAVWQSLGRWKSEFDPTGYGFAVFNAHRTMLQLKRKQRRRERLLPRTSMEAAEGLAASAEDPVEVAQSNDQANSVKAAIARLSPVEREVITLYYAQELTLKQVGETLGITKERVRQSLHGARNRLREMLVSQNF